MISVKQLLAIVAALLYLVLTWFLGVWLHLTGVRLLIVRLFLLAIGLAIAGAILWWVKLNAAKDETGDKAASSAEERGDAARETAHVLGQAEGSLRRAQLLRRARFHKLSAVVFLGARGAGKTAAVLGSGLDANLLAGQVSSDGSAIAPTGLLNAWLAGKTLFFEAGADLLADAAAWAALVRKLAPPKLRSIFSSKAQQPRAVTVCIDSEQLIRRDGPEKLAAAVRQIQARLREMSQQLAVSFPVYVLFNKVDALPFFAEYAANLSDAEAGQFLGVTLASAAPPSGTYAEEQTKRLTLAFEDLFRTLGARRVELLARERTAERTAGIYEFPREFRKLRNNVVALLVELCRPSQLVVSPFLAGFYFAGRRTVVVSTASGAELTGVATSTAEMPTGATRVFNLRQLKRPSPAAAAGQPAGATRVFDLRKLQETSLGMTQANAPLQQEVQQPVFLSGLFSDVLLGDRGAAKRAFASRKVVFWRRGVLTTAAATAFTLLVGFVASYTHNTRLENDVINTEALLSTAAAVTPAADLRLMEPARQTLATLLRYSSDRPTRFGWGLYMGRDLYPLACQVYARRAQPELLNPVRAGIAKHLRDLPQQQGSQDFGAVYDQLKAYLMLTSNPEQGNATFLTPVLVQSWTEYVNGGRPLDTQATEEARSHFDFIAAHLSEAETPLAHGCLTGEPDSYAIGNARHYLALFPAAERVYRGMLATVNKQSHGVLFNDDYPESRFVVVNRRWVPGAFTKAGWTSMQAALASPAKYLNAESWVLGDSTALPDAATLARDINDRYREDYKNAWQDFLLKTNVPTFQDDAQSVAHLKQLAGPESPLLSLFCVAAQNTAVDDKSISEPFQALQSVVPPGCSDKYIGPPNKPYVDALAKVAIALDNEVAQKPQIPDALKQATNGAVDDVQGAVLQIAGGFPSKDPLGVGRRAQTLLMEPVHKEQFVPGVSAGAKSLCDTLNQVFAKAPFNPNGRQAAGIDDLQYVFQPESGLLAKLYNDELKQSGSLSAEDGQFHPSAGAKLNPHFLSFFNRAEQIQHALYAGGSQPKVSFKVTLHAPDGVATWLVIDGQTLNSTAGATATADFVWPGPTADGVILKAGTSSFQIQSWPGALGVFEFFSKATQIQFSGDKVQLAFTPMMGGETHSTFRFDVDFSGGVPVFKRNYMSSLTGQCVTRVQQ